MFHLSLVLGPLSLTIGWGIADGEEGYAEDDPTVEEEEEYASPFGVCHDLFVPSVEYEEEEEEP